MRKKTNITPQESPVKEYIKEQSKPSIRKDKIYQDFNDNFWIMNTKSKVSIGNQLFYNGDQYSPQERKEVRMRGQQPLVLNETQRLVDNLLGMHSKIMTDTICVGRNHNNDQACSFLNYIIKWIEQINNLKQTENAVFKDGVIKGAGWVEMMWDKMNGRWGYPSIEKTQKEEIYHGLFTKPDASDADNNLIQERANVLDNFFSYTYSLSWYLVDPTAYNTTIQSIKKNLNGYYLLAQSGGAGQNTSGVQESVFDPRQEVQESVFNPAGIGTATPSGASRSPYFNLDYYLDNLTIETAYSAKIESGGPMAYKNISFTVSEPNGLTLPLNLYRAVNEVYNQRIRTSSDSNNFINYASGMYCMVIRFYGYNEQGQLVQPITDNVVGSTDPNAAVEKFIFYQQTSLSYSVGSRLTEYKITGAAPSTRIGFSSDRGSIPFNMQFTGNTVKDILVGQIQQQTASQAAGDQTRNGAPIKSSPPVKVGDLSMREQAAIAAGTDPNTVNDQGMAFGGGGL